MFSFENLKVWQDSRKLVSSVYRLIEKFPPSEKFALSDQLRRAVISVPSNIAEGSGRFSNKEKIRFIEISYGSLMEVYCQLILAYDLQYISKEELESESQKINEISKMLKALKKNFSNPNPSAGQ